MGDAHAWGQLGGASELPQGLGNSRRRSGQTADRRSTRRGRIHCRARRGAPGRPGRGQVRRHATPLEGFPVTFHFRCFICNPHNNLMRWGPCLQYFTSEETLRGQVALLKSHGWQGRGGNSDPDQLYPIVLTLQVLMRWFSVSLDSCISRARLQQNYFVPIHKHSISSLQLINIPSILLYNFVFF